MDVQTKRAVIAFSVLGAVVVGLAFALSFGGDGDADRADVARVGEPDQGATPKPVGEVRFVTPEPVFVAPRETDPKQAALVDVGMRAVFAHCAGFSIRDGATFDGTLVFRSKGKPERVNVSMKLADDTKSNGHVLHYMVTFDDSEKPAMIRALKDISAELCGFESDDVDVPVRL